MPGGVLILRYDDESVENIRAIHSRHIAVAEKLGFEVFDVNPIVLAKFFGQRSENNTNGKPLIKAIGDIKQLDELRTMASVATPDPHRDEFLLREIYLKRYGDSYIDPTQRYEWEQYVIAQEGKNTAIKNRKLLFGGLIFAKRTR